MYAVSIVLLLLVLPLVSVGTEAFLLHGAPIGMALIGKWFVFWAVGVRLFLAGLRQVLQPQFTAETIFDIADRRSHAIVRELGLANLSMGALGILTLAYPGWMTPAALVGGLYYGLAGLGHVARGGGNAHERVALVSDLLIFALLAAVVASRLIGQLT